MTSAAVKSAHVHHHPPILEIVHPILDTTDKVFDGADKLRTAFKVVAASEAFRHYGVLNILRWKLPRNVAGNFRGMVRSARWNTYFHYVTEHGEWLSNVGTFASFAANLAELGNEFEKVHRSKADRVLAAGQYAALAGTAAERVLTGTVTGSVHLAYMSMRGYCMMLGLAGGRAQTAANACIATLNRADSYVTTAEHAITDTKNQAGAVYWAADAVPHVVTIMMRRMRRMFSWKDEGFLEPPVPKLSKGGERIYRAWGGQSYPKGSPERPGVCFSTLKPNSRAEAEKLFALFEWGNSCLKVTEFRVPAGIVIWTGTVDPGDARLRNLAGPQIFIENPAAQRVVEITTSDLRNDLGGAWVYTRPIPNPPTWH